RHNIRGRRLSLRRHSSRLHGRDRGHGHHNSHQLGECDRVRSLLLLLHELPLLQLRMLAFDLLACGYHQQPLRRRLLQSLLQGLDLGQCLLGNACQLRFDQHLGIRQQERAELERRCAHRMHLQELQLLRTCRQPLCLQALFQDL
ncbi:hypothetical protein D027_4034B, partial [Vibrio parahaemolyticus 861]